jgi:hypothetical protein
LRWIEDELGSIDTLIRNSGSGGSAKLTLADGTVVFTHTFGTLADVLKRAEAEGREPTDAEVIKRAQPPKGSGSYENAASRKNTRDVASAWFEKKKADGEVFFTWPELARHLADEVGVAEASRFMRKTYRGKGEDIPPDTELFADRLGERPHTKTPGLSDLLGLFGDPFSDLLAEETKTTVTAKTAPSGQKGTRRGIPTRRPASSSIRYTRYSSNTATIYP